MKIYEILCITCIFIESNEWKIENVITAVHDFVEIFIQTTFIQYYSRWNWNILSVRIVKKLSWIWTTKKICLKFFMFFSCDWIIFSSTRAVAFKQDRRQIFLNSVERNKILWISSICDFEYLQIKKISNRVCVQVCGPKGSNWLTVGKSLTLSVYTYLLFGVYI